MTKADIVAEIESNVTHAEQPVLVDTEGATTAYDVLVIYRLANGTYQRGKQPILVVDEGEASEEAYYARRQLADFTVSAFKTNVRTALATFISNNAPALKASIDTIDTDENFAVVTLYRTDGSGNVTAHKRFVEGDAQGNIVDNYPLG